MHTEGQGKTEVKAWVVNCPWSNTAVMGETCERCKFFQGKVNIVKRVQFKDKEPENQLTGYAIKCKFPRVLHMAKVESIIEFPEVKDGVHGNT